MKIIQISAAYKPAYIYGGPTMSVAKLCEEIVRYANENQGKTKLEVLTTTANGKDELNIDANQLQVVDGVPVTYFTRITKDHTHFSPSLLLNLRRMIMAHKRDSTNSNRDQVLDGDNGLLIHIHAWWNLVSLLSCVVAKWYKIPVVLSPRGMLTAYTTGNRNSKAKYIIHNLLGKHLLKSCNVHATSEQEKNDILKIVNPQSITIIPNLVELNDRQETRLKEQEVNPAFKLIFLSRIEEKKGLALLFDVLANLEINWKLTIAGSGEQSYVESLKQKAEALKINDSINWVGQIKNKDKFKLLAEHDLMVLTSYNENFANVVIESLSVGTPVLISNQVGLADYVLKRKFGWTCGLLPEEIKAQLLLAHESLTERLSINEIAPQQIKEDFNAGTLVKKYLELYKKVQ